MKKKELREMTSDELGAKLKEVQEEQFKLKLQQVSGQLEHPSRIKDMRRNVARIKTFQQQRNAED
jgi:large subunit ribosomal protein L29